MHIKSLTTLILFMLVAMNAIYGQEATPDWENPEVFAVNLEKTRATAIPYADNQTEIGRAHV